MDRSAWDGGGVFQEGAQESHGGELDGHAESVVAPSTSGDELEVDPIEVKEPPELGWRWFAAESSIATALLGTQKSHWHP